MGESVITRSPHVLQRSLDGEYVLYHSGTDSAMVLDAVGSMVWNALESAPTTQELVEVLAAQFDRRPDEIATDLEPLLVDLADAQLIRVGRQRPGDDW